MEMVKRLCGECARNCVAIILRLSRDCVGVVKGLSRHCRWINVTGYLVMVKDLSGDCQVMVWGLSRHCLGIVQGLSRDSLGTFWWLSGATILVIVWTWSGDVWGWSGIVWVW